MEERPTTTESPDRSWRALWLAGGALGLVALIAATAGDALPRLVRGYNPVPPVYSGEVPELTWERWREHGSGREVVSVHSRSWPEGELGEVHLSVQRAAGEDPFIAVTRVGPEPAWSRRTRWSLLADGSAVRIDRAGEGFDGRSVKLGVEETLRAGISLPALKQLAAAGRAELVLDGERIEVAGEFLQALGELASQPAPQPR